MRSGLLLVGALILAALGVWVLAASSERRSPDAPVAADALPVQVFWNGDAVATLEPEDARDEPFLTDLLPEGARDVAAWVLLAVKGDAGRRMRIAEPGTRFSDPAVRFYLLEGRPALGVFRPLEDGMNDAARRAVGKPMAYLAQVVEVWVWTVEPRPDPIHIATSELDIVVDGRPPVRAEAEALSALPVSLPHGRSGHPGWALAEVVGLVIEPTLVARVAVLVGDAEAAAVSGTLLRSADAAVLLRPNRKGALALDGSGRDAAGADVGVRVRGVTQLVVTTGTERPPVKLVPPAIEPTLAERMEARKALNAERDKVRAIVARHPERDAREELVDLLEHEHPRVRADAIQGLKRWGDTSEIMYRHLETETDAEVRGIAFNEISRIAPAEYMERLVRFVGPVKNPMNKDAAKAIKRIARRTGEPMPAGLPDWVRRGGKR